jgi:hypothetical protein
MGAFSRDEDDLRSTNRHREAQQRLADARSRNQRRDHGTATGNWRHEFDLHVVQKGETLADIAQQVYGSADSWPRIQQANPVILRDPEVVHAGLVLRIPRGEGTPLA